MSKEIAEIESDLSAHACSTSHGCNGQTWPPGVPPPHDAANLYELTRYEYFNHTHLFLDTDFSVVTRLSDAYRADIDELIAFSLDKLNAAVDGKRTSEEVRFKMRSLFSGYKHFDPTRGGLYVLDLLLSDSAAATKTTTTTTDVVVHKRVNLMRPLGAIELVPASSDTRWLFNASSVHVYVSFTASDSDADVAAFFKSLYDLVLKRPVDSWPNVRVNVVLLLSNLGSRQQESSPRHKYESLVREFNASLLASDPLQRQHALDAVAFHQIVLKQQQQQDDDDDMLANSENYRQLRMAEHAAAHLAGDTIVLMVPQCGQFSSELFKHARLHTLRARQVFFPLQFRQYMPAIAYASRGAAPSFVDVHRDNGFMDMYNYDFAAYYNADYVHTRQMAIDAEPTLVDADRFAAHFSDLYELFASNEQLDVFRATDIEVRCRWRLVDKCDRRHGSADAKRRCVDERDASLAAKGQLAIHLINNLDNKF